jgi:hypothetical protein
MAKQSSTERLLLPKATIVELDGQSITVPFDKHENVTANKIVVAQLRSSLQYALKSYRDGETVMSPKELNDLAMAVKNMTATSKEIYETAEPITTIRPTTDVDVDAEDFSFDSIKKPE